jgi:hypothetical protein
MTQHLVTFVAGDHARYVGMVMAQHGVPLCSGDEVDVVKGQETEPEDYVLVNFRGGFYNVCAEDLVWLHGA